MRKSCTNISIEELIQNNLTCKTNKIDSTGRSKYFCCFCGSNIKGGPDGIKIHLLNVHDVDLELNRDDQKENQLKLGKKCFPTKKFVLCQYEGCKKSFDDLSNKEILDHVETHRPTQNPTTNSSEKRKRDDNNARKISIKKLIENNLTYKTDKKNKQGSYTYFCCLCGSNIKCGPSAIKTHLLEVHNVDPELNRDDQKENQLKLGKKCNKKKTTKRDFTSCQYEGCKKSFDDLSDKEIIDHVETHRPEQNLNINLTIADEQDENEQDENVQEHKRRKLQ